MAVSEYEIFWQEALKLARQEMGEQAFPVWFDLEFLSSAGDTITVAVPSNFYLDRLIQRRYHTLLETKLLELTGREIHLSFEVVPSKKRETAQKEEAEHDSEKPKTKTKAPAEKKPVNKSKHSQLREDYTFERYIVGENNDYAVSVAKAIGLNPGTSYNPFLIYGGVGLGKTHLMHAIGSFIYQNSDHKIICITSENFLNEFIQAIGDKNTSAAFKNKFRMTDVFLMDDIQFFQEKEQVQEELFHTFNSLLEAKKQIVFTCDRPVSELKKLPERLKSRFELCLKVDLQPPKYETRCAILKKNAEERGITIPDTVIDLISKNISTNIRDLEGAINTLIPYAELKKTLITLEIAQNLLRDMFASPKLENLSIDLIRRVVASYFSLTPNDLKGRKKNKNVALARHIAMYISYEIAEYSTTEIGQDFGGRDHTTVMHSCNVIRDTLQSDPTMQPTIDNLKRLIREESARH
jgi:chromosomal replication initiator protein